MSSIIVNITGTVYEELIDSSGFGLDDRENELDKQTRAAIKAAPTSAVGFGSRTTVKLSVEQARRLERSLYGMAEARSPRSGDFSAATQHALFKAAHAIRVSLHIAKELDS